MIENKVVAITGASSGIGEATARHLAARGAKLMLGARGENALRKVCADIVADGGSADYATIDVARREDVAKLVACAEQQFGRLDVLISNAGAMPIGPLAELALDDWERMIDVNVKGVLWGIAAALPIFQRQKAGHFITIASTAARKIVPNMAVYSGTKAAVAAIMDGLRQEVAGSLRVTTIYPGYTDTNFANHVRNAEVRTQLKKAGDSYAMAPNAVAAAIAHAIEQPEDVTIGEIVIRSRNQP
jgi:NADP-dependent 3-hydroxy acid dehydrogenase YdfG